MDLTQAQLAARLGSSRQRVNATMAEFERKGWIRVDGRRVVVTDPDALRSALER